MINESDSSDPKDLTSDNALSNSSPDSSSTYPINGSFWISKDGDIQKNMTDGTGNSTSLSDIETQKNFGIGSRSTTSKSDSPDSPDSSDRSDNNSYSDKQSSKHSSSLNSSNKRETVIDILLNQMNQTTSSTELLSDERSEENDSFESSLKMKNMVRYDEEYNGEIEKIDKITFIVSLILIVISGAIIIAFLIKQSDTLDLCGDDSDGDDGGLFCLDSWQLLANTLTMIVIFLSVGSLMGVWATKRNINIGYTRKTLHFMSFFLPFGINKIFPLEGNVLVTLLKFWLITIVFFLAIKVIRRKIKLALLIFRSIDRPADRPYTLKWMFTQYIASTIALIPFVYLWDSWSENDTYSDNLSLILVIIGGLGDGLAEPIGITFGKHKYKTRALWYDGKLWNGSFERSFEGSFMVFIVSICALAGFYYVFTVGQLFIAMLTVPIIMTLTEAFSPRTWDSPFLFLIGAALLSGIVKIPVDNIKYLWIYLFVTGIILTIITGYILNKCRMEKPEKWYKNEWLFLSIGATLITLSAYTMAIYDLVKNV